MRACNKEIPSLLLPTPPLPAVHMPSGASGMLTVLSHPTTAISGTLTATVAPTVKTVLLSGTQVHTNQADPLTQLLANYGKEGLF